MVLREVTTFADYQLMFRACRARQDVVGLDDGLASHSQAILTWGVAGGGWQHKHVVFSFRFTMADLISFYTAPMGGRGSDVVVGQRIERTAVCISFAAVLGVWSSNLNQLASLFPCALDDGGADDDDVAAAISRSNVETGERGRGARTAPQCFGPQCGTAKCCCGERAASLSDKRRAWSARTREPKGAERPEAGPRWAIARNRQGWKL